jgi:predicted glycosyltransferase
MSVLFHVQHLLGSGHLHRVALIARAVAAQGGEAVVASGGMTVPGLDLGGAGLVQLPACRAADSGFKTLLDGDGHPLDDTWRARRLAATLAVFDDRRPRVLVVEMFPFGRRPFRFELLPLIERARAARVPVLVSVRDLLIGQDKPGRADEIAALVKERVDRVLVHGDPRLFRFEETFPRAAAIADKLAYTGLVVRPVPLDDRADGRDEVLVSAGGGAVGERLFATALAARPLSRARDRAWRFLVGAQAAAPAIAAEPGLIVEPARPDFAALLSRAALSISQGGYNTVMEILATRARAVVVPFAEGQESEQTRRAERLAAQGRLTALPETGLTPEALAAAVDAALARPRPDAAPYDLDGAATSARLIAGWAKRS